MRYFVTNPDDDAVQNYIRYVISEVGGSISLTELRKKMHVRFSCVPGLIADEKTIRRVYRNFGKGMYRIKNGMVFLDR